jgi:hypothetical protein
MYDFKMLLDSGHALTAGNTNSTNVVNFGYDKPQVGSGAVRVGLHVSVTAAFTCANSGVYVDICGGSTTSPTTKLITRILTKANLKNAGYHAFIPLPPVDMTSLSYIRAKYRKVSEQATAGSVTAWIGPDVDGGA